MLSARRQSAANLGKRSLRQALAISAGKTADVAEAVYVQPLGRARHLVRDPCDLTTFEAVSKGEFETGDRVYLAAPQGQGRPLILDSMNSGPSQVASAPSIPSRRRYAPRPVTAPGCPVFVPRPSWGLLRSEAGQYAVSRYNGATRVGDLAPFDAPDGWGAVSRPWPVRFRRDGGLIMRAPTGNAGVAARVGGEWKVWDFGVPNADLNFTEPVWNLAGDKVFVSLPGFGIGRWPAPFDDRAGLTPAFREFLEPTTEQIYICDTPRGLVAAAVDNKIYRREGGTWIMAEIGEAVHGTSGGVAYVGDDLIFRGGEVFDMRTGETWELAGWGPLPGGAASASGGAFISYPVTTDPESDTETRVMSIFPATPRGTTWASTCDMIAVAVEDPEGWQLLALRGIN